MRGSLTVCGLNESAAETEQRAAECLSPHAGITGIVTTRQEHLADISHFMFRIFVFFKIKIKDKCVQQKQEGEFVVIRVRLNPAASVCIPPSICN